MPLFGSNDAAMQKVEVGVEAVSIEQGHVVELAGSIVDRFGRSILRWIGVNDALRQRLARPQRQHQKGRETKRLHFCLPPLELRPRRTA